MEITSAQYVNDRDGNNSSVIATIDGVSLEVPLDPDNRHYQAILEWAKEDGNTIQEAD
jgi:hypothetical protein